MVNRNIVKRHPVFAFYLLAFTLSWLGWLPQTLYAYGKFPFDTPLFNLLGGVGPTLAAVLVVLVLREQGDIRALFVPVLRWQAPFVWFALALGFWPAVVILMLGAARIAGYTLPTIPKSVWGSLFPVFLMMLLSNVWEEIGWRGFALPWLQKKYSDLVIVLVMGSLWTLWHLPLLFNPASPMSNLPWYGEFVFNLSLTAIYTWLYRHTDGSLFFVSIFHAMSNTVAFLLLEAKAYTVTYNFMVGTTALIAVVLFLSYGPRRLVKSG